MRSPNKSRSDRATRSGRSHAFLKLRAVLPLVGTNPVCDHREHPREAQCKSRSDRPRGRSHASLKLRAVLPAVGEFATIGSTHAKPNASHEVTAPRAVGVLTTSCNSRMISIPKLFFSNLLSKIGCQPPKSLISLNRKGIHLSCLPLQFSKLLIGAFFRSKEFHQIRNH